MMTCHVVDAKPAQGIAFVCGEAEEPALCHFCGQPAAYLCDWKVRKPVAVRAADLKVGDQRCTPSGTVVYCSTEAGFTYLAFERGDAIHQVKVPADGTFMMWREATCDQPCCYFCVREPGDDVHHCMDHWPEIGRTAA